MEGGSGLRELQADIAELEARDSHDELLPLPLTPIIPMR